MDKIDQYLYLIDDIASIYEKILNFSFFCQNFHNVSMCKNENCDVGNFVKRLIKNIRFNHLIDQKKKKIILFIIVLMQKTFVSLLELYLDKKIYVNFMECFK